MKKAKTHYINFRNPSVNQKDLSRALHKLWFDLIRFPEMFKNNNEHQESPFFGNRKYPSSKKLFFHNFEHYILTVRELEHANGGPLHRPQEDVAQTCRLCFSTFESHSTLLDHLEATEACRDKYKDDGHQYCFICDKTFETVSFYLYFTNIKMILYKLFKKKIIAT